MNLSIHAKHVECNYFSIAFQIQNEVLHIIEDYSLLKNC
jgi:hypothetical protein